MKIINRIKHSAFYYRMKHSIRIYDVLYVDSTELLDKAQKVLRPLPEGCELVKLTQENKNNYKCKWKVNKILSVEGEAWAVVNNDNEIIAYHYGTYRDNNSILFKVKNCDYEHTENGAGSIPYISRSKKLKVQKYRECKGGHGHSP